VDQARGIGYCVNEIVSRKSLSHILDSRTSLARASESLAESPVKLLQSLQIIH
jgi:hypothetical protein